MTSQCQLYDCYTYTYSTRSDMDSARRAKALSKTGGSPRVVRYHQHGRRRTVVLHVGHDAISEAVIRAAAGR